jgi:hypothetical protein
VHKAIQVLRQASSSSSGALQATTTAKHSVSGNAAPRATSSYLNPLNCCCAHLCSYHNKKGASFSKSSGDYISRTRCGVQCWPARISHACLLHICFACRLLQ